MNRNMRDDSDDKHKKSKKNIDAMDKNSANEK